MLFVKPREDKAWVWTHFAGSCHELPLADIVKIVSNNKDLRMLRLQLGEETLSSWIETANQIGNAFLNNPHFTLDEKEIEVSLNGVKETLAKEVANFLNSSSPWLTCLRINNGLGSYGTGVFSKMGASFSTLRKIAVDDYPSFSINLLASAGTSVLEIFDLGIGERSSVPYIQNLVDALLRKDTLKTVKLSFTGNEAPPAESSQILARYLAQCKLECLELHCVVLIGEDGEDGYDKWVDSMEVLLTSGLASNTSIGKLFLRAHHYHGRVGGVLRDFLERCQIKSLKLRFNTVERGSQILADGLRHNRWVNNLEIDNEEFAPLTRMLTIQDAFRLPLLPLETWKLDCNKLDEDALNHVCGLIRRQIPTLTSIYLEVDFPRIFKERFMTALLQAAVESTSIKSIGLHVSNYYTDEWCAGLMATFLPRLLNISSLNLKLKLSTGSAEMKETLYQGAFLNTGLTSSLTLDPYSSEDPEFQNKLKVICIRNETAKVLRDRSTSLRDFDLSAAIENVQRRCGDVGVSPDPFVIEMIYAAFRAQPKTVRGIEIYLGRD